MNSCFNDQGLLSGIIQFSNFIEGFGRSSIQEAECALRTNVRRIVLDRCAILSQNSIIRIYLLAKLCFQKICRIPHYSTPMKLPRIIWWCLRKNQGKFLHAEGLILTVVKLDSLINPSPRIIFPAIW
uniref:Uncharacterized protein n=1 Tax=Opuntia streptacantha TaxID=393608 RepID=A0A7C9DP02_OPUST